MPRAVMPRGPLPWLIALEVLALAALGFAGWHLLSGRLAPPQPSLSVALPKPRSATPSPVPTVTAPARPHTPTPHPTITPGLSTDPAFWRQDLTQVNRDESALEQIEMKAVQAVEAFTRAYLKAVVIPAVQAASQRTGGP